MNLAAFERMLVLAKARSSIFGNAGGAKRQNRHGDAV